MPVTTGGEPGGWQRLQPRRPRALLLAGVVVLVVVLGLWSARPSPSSPELEVTRDDGAASRDPAPEGREAQARLPSLPGTWTRLEDAPVGPPGSYAGVWAPDASAGRNAGELVVVGSGAQGVRRAAAYDPRARRWRLLPPLPASAAIGSGHLMAWTGQEVIVWGTWRPTRTQPVGVAYDPSLDRWRELPAAPVSDLGPDPVGVWSGSELIVWGGTLSREVRPERPAGMAYDPSTDGWRALPAAPLPAVTQADGVWTPHGLVAWGSTAADPEDPPVAGGTFAVLYDPAARRWRRLDDPPLHRPARAAAAWSGSHVVFWGRPALDDPGGPPTAAALAVPEGGWAAAAAARRGWPPPVEMDGMQAQWSGSHLLAVGGPPRLAPVAVDGEDPGSWLLLGDWPFASTADPVAAWTGEELLVWGGIHADGRRSVELLSWRAD